MLGQLLVPDRYLIDWPDGVGMAVELTGDAKRLTVSVRILGDREEREVSRQVITGFEQWAVDWQKQNLVSI